MVAAVYSVGPHDRAVALDEVPRPPGGPAHAHVVAREGTTRLLYYVADAWGTPNGERPEHRVAICTFGTVWGVYLGAPNDEALTNHPLYERGLDFYGAFRVEASSWAAALERLALRKDAAGRAQKELSHWIVTMEDSTFECVALHLAVEVRAQSMTDVLADSLGRSASR